MNGDKWAIRMGNWKEYGWLKTSFPYFPSLSWLRFRSLRSQDRGNMGTGNKDFGLYGFFVWAGLYISHFIFWDK